MNNWPNMTAVDLEKIMKVLENTPQPTYVPTECTNPSGIFKVQNNFNHVRVSPLTTAAVDDYAYFMKMWSEAVSNMKSHSTQPAEPDAEFVSILFEKE